jgi:pimeloyl-ACP methyl ester carboxylesterase
MSSRPGPSRRPWMPWACGGSRWWASSYGGFVGYRMAAMYPEAVERVATVSSGVCIEEDDLAAGLFSVTDIKEAAELLVPRRPEDVRRLVKLTFVRPPPIMPAFFLKDYIDVCFLTPC